MKRIGVFFFLFLIIPAIASSQPIAGDGIQGIPITLSNKTFSGLSLSVGTKVFTDSPYALTETDTVLRCDATAGAIVLNLQTAVGKSGRTLWIKKIDSSVNSVTVVANGAERIDGAASKAILVQYDSLTLISDGANWNLH
jgi:hypothetical protein